MREIGEQEQQNQQQEGSTEKAFASLTNQPQEPEPSRDATGRELDALVAEKVMGWRRAGTSMPHWPRHYTNPELPDHHQETPHFSTDIAAAWSVVETLIERGHYPDLVTTHADGGLKWRCSIDRYTNPDDALDPFPVVERAVTAPLAICLAALTLASLMVPR